MKNLIIVISLIACMALAAGCGSANVPSVQASSSKSDQNELRRSGENVARPADKLIPAPAPANLNAGSGENVARIADESNPLFVVADSNPCSRTILSPQISTMGFNYTLTTINGELVVPPPGTKTYKDLHPNVVVDPNPGCETSLLPQISTIGDNYAPVTINGELVVPPPGTKTYEDFHPSKP